MNSAKRFMKSYQYQPYCIVQKCGSWGRRMKTDGNQYKM